MRKLFVFLILAILSVQLYAQDESVFPVINLDEFLADEIIVKNITFFPTYIVDDEQRVIHFLDYDVMKWKYIEYPENETQARIGFDFNEDIFFRYTVEIYSGDYEYNFETQEWALPELENFTYAEDSETSDEFCGLGFVPEYLESNTWNLKGYEQIEDELLITFCDLATNTEYIFSPLEVGEKCGMTEVGYMSHDIKDGNLYILSYGFNGDVTQICLHDVDKQEYTIIGKFEKRFDRISYEYGQDDKHIYAGIKKLELDQYGLPESHLDGNVIDLFEINLDSEHAIKRITQYANTETILISNEQVSTGNGFQYLWAEPIGENEEAIYLYTNETTEPTLLFTREKENLGYKFYKITLSPSGQYVRIQEPNIFQERLDSVFLDFYTINGQFLHSEEFEFPYPHNRNTYWLDDTITIVLPQNYANPSIEIMHPLTIIQIHDNDIVNVKQRLDYNGIGGRGATRPFMIEEKYYFLLGYDDGIYLYDIENDKRVSFMIHDNLDCFGVSGFEESIFVGVWNDCWTREHYIFRAELNVSINPSGD